MDDKKQQSGFALLVSLVVVTAVLSIGLVILDLSIKQVRLAATTKDSETAFHAANAGKECGLYWRRQAAAAMEGGMVTPDIACFGVNAGPQSAGSVGYTGDGQAHLYEYDFTWNGGDRCTRIATVVAAADSAGSGVAVTNMQSVIPGYPTAGTFDCPAGARCTVMSVKGYNKGCGQINAYGTIEREILLRF